jgi:hypothetical protein
VSDGSGFETVTCSTRLLFATLWPMPSRFVDAFAVVQTLAKDIEANKVHFFSPSYQKSEVRKNFIDKFHIALGWNVNYDWQKMLFGNVVRARKNLQKIR